MRAFCIRPPFRSRRNLPELDSIFMHRFARGHRISAGAIRRGRVSDMPCPYKRVLRLQSASTDGNGSRAARAIYACAVLLRGDDWIFQRADAADADFDDVAGGQRAHTGRRAGGDHVAWFERHHLRNEADYSINGKDHFRRVSRLFPGSIHESFEREAGRREFGFEDGPKGQKVSKPFARVNWTSSFCKSRAVTSFKQVYPRT